MSGSSSLSLATPAPSDPNITTRASKLLPLAHQGGLRDECAVILSGALPATNAVLSHFVTKDISTSTFKCMLHEHGRPCKYTRMKRPSRALAHVRKHLNLREFTCKGACGRGNCDATFFSRADLNSHKYHTGRFIQCALCGARILKKNEERHRQTTRCRSKHA